MIRVGIIGFGSIGREVTAYLLRGKVDQCGLSGVLVRRPSSSNLPDTYARDSLTDLLRDKPKVVVEAAGQQAVAEYAAAVLVAGADFVCTSVAALADESLLDKLRVTARGSGAKLIIPSGAGGAFDALRAAAVGGLEVVEVEQRKPARLLLDDETIGGEAATLAYDGDALGAIQAYPLTTNTIAAIALAGVGFRQTRVRVIADPSANSNTIKMVATGAFGRLSFVLRNVPSSNPSTSALTAMSIVATLRDTVGELAFRG